MPSTILQNRPSRVAIVTGAAKGIGEAIALRLADDGLDIALFDLPQERAGLDAVASALKGKGRRALVLVGDVTVEDDVAAMVDSTVAELGGLDVMIANAGVFWLKPFVDSTTEEWDRMFAVNTRGVMLCYKHAARQMIKQGRGGRIIGAASIAAKQGFPKAAAYSSSKFALRGLTQCVALELQPYNITVNLYAPGLIPTTLTIQPEDVVNGGPCTTIMKTAGIPTTTPVGPASSVAELVSYIIKPEAYFVNGQCLNLNGGAVMD
ncbi:NAD(P)-binding protein [Earliella scabrosa]|nr:NAD(P)-binding protein [Earliella scabrosa]